MTVLARKDGLALVLAIMTARGQRCPSCGHATRVTSKRWAKCESCGERVQRRTKAEVEAMLEKALP